MFAKVCEMPKSFVVRNNEVVEYARDVPVKLSAFCPNEDLTEGRFSWEVEEERVL